MIVVKSHPQRSFSSSPSPKKLNQTRLSLRPIPPLWQIAYASGISICHIQTNENNPHRKIYMSRRDGGGTEEPESKIDVNSSASGFLTKRNQIAHLPPVPH